MMAAPYLPQRGSIAARAIAYLSRFPGQEVQSPELAAAINLTNVNAISAFLATPMRHHAIERSTRDGKAYWRIGINAPPQKRGETTDSGGDLDEITESSACTIPSDAVTPMPTLARQSWCPVAQDVESLGSGGEPAESIPCPAPPAPLGLGWKAPRIPVYLADAPMPDVATEFADDAAVIDAEFDPDFQEVRRDLGLIISSVIPERAQAALDDAGPDTSPKGAEAACAPTAPCGRNAATPNDGVVAQCVYPGSNDMFCCALWSDGTFTIRPSDGEPLMLGKHDAGALMRYISDILSARARAAA